MKGCVSDLHSLEHCSNNICYVDKHSEERSPRFLRRQRLWPTSNQRGDASVVKDVYDAIHDDDDDDHDDDDADDDDMMLAEYHLPPLYPCQGIFVSACPLL
ncbi:hypothetical protein QTP88_014026 [Uroleucon formosanum]